MVEISAEDAEILETTKKRAERWQRYVELKTQAEAMHKNLRSGLELLRYGLEASPKRLGGVVQRGDAQMVLPSADGLRTVSENLQSVCREIYDLDRLLRQWNVAT